MAEEKIANTHLDGGIERTDSKSKFDAVSHLEIGGDDLKKDHVDYNRIDSEVAKV